MIEREKNRENGIRLAVMKREYIAKVKKIKSLTEENEQLVDRVAQAEVDHETKDSEIKALTHKKAEYRNKISILNDEKKALTQVLACSEDNK